MNKNKYGLMAGILAVITTVLLYVLLVDNLFKIPMAYITLCAVLISELIATAAFVVIKNSYKRIAVVSVFGAQAVLLLVASILFVNIFVFAYVSFTVLFMLSFVAAIFLLLFVFKFRNEADVQQTEFKSAKINMVTIRAMVNELIHSEKGVLYKKELLALDENLRFSDDSVQIEMDQDIKQKVAYLAENMGAPDFDAIHTISEINNMIKQRNFIAKNQKAFR